MHFKNSAERSMHSHVGLLAAAMVLTCACAGASPRADESAGSRESAVWAPKELNFVYQAFTVKYSCDGLQDKMRSVLTKLGAHDVQVSGFGCMQSGPELLPGVRIRMNVLRPAGEQGGHAVPAHWKMVDLVAREPAEAAADCELMEQIKQQVLPLFTTRNLDYGSTCVPRQLVIGATRLKTEVLVAEQSVGPKSAAR